MGKVKAYTFGYDIDEMEYLEKEYPIFKSKTEAIKEAIQFRFPKSTDLKKEIAIKINRLREEIKEREKQIKQYNDMLWGIDNRPKGDDDE